MSGVVGLPLCIWNDLALGWWWGGGVTWDNSEDLTASSTNLSTDLLNMICNELNYFTCNICTWFLKRSHFRRVFVKSWYQKRIQISCMKMLLICSVVRSCEHCRLILSVVYLYLFTCWHVLSSGLHLRHLSIMTHQGTSIRVSSLTSKSVYVCVCIWSGVCPCSAD